MADDDADVLSCSLPFIHFSFNPAILFPFFSSPLLLFPSLSISCLFLSFSFLVAFAFRLFPSHFSRFYLFIYFPCLFFFALFHLSFPFYFSCPLLLSLTSLYSSYSSNNFIFIPSLSVPLCFCFPLLFSPFFSLSLIFSPHFSFPFLSSPLLSSLLSCLMTLSQSRPGLPVVPLNGFVLLHKMPECSVSSAKSHEAGDGGRLIAPLPSDRDWMPERAGPGSLISPPALSHNRSDVIATDGGLITERIVQFIAPHAPQLCIVFQLNGDLEAARCNPSQSS